MHIVTSGVCLPPLPCLGGNTIGGAIAGAGGVAIAKGAASSVIGIFVSALSACVAWIVGHVIDLILTAPSVDLGSAWFRSEELTMASLLELVVLPLLMVGSIGPVLKQDFRRLARVWGVGLPVAVLAGIAGAQFVGLALRATDGLCKFVLAESGQHLVVRTSGLMVTILAMTAPGFVQIVLFFLLIVGSVMVWLELLVRTVAIYIALFFTPLALAAFIWPATAATAKRMVELLAALILSKFIIVATLTLGFAAVVGGSGPDDALVGAGVLAMAGFAPFCLLRLAPIAEVAAIAHLEGMSRRPFRAASRAATTAAMAPGHPVVRAVLSQVGRGDSNIQSSPVKPRPMAERQPDFPPSTESGSGHG